MISREHGAGRLSRIPDLSPNPLSTTNHLERGHFLMVILCYVTVITLCFETDP